MMQKYKLLANDPFFFFLAPVVTGVCRPGELLAIMGASGAGKTTLLNVLTHRNNDKLRITGDLFVNGRRVDPDTLTSRSAYVQQDDLFTGLITVREQLIFQVRNWISQHSFVNNCLF